MSGSCDRARRPPTRSGSWTPRRTRRPGLPLSAPPGIVGVAVAIVLTVVAGVAWHALDRRNLIPGPDLGAEESSLTKFYALVPLMLAVHVAVPLLALVLRGERFSPNNRLPGAWVYWMGVVQIGVCLSFVYGGLTQLAAIVLAALWVAGIGVLGLEAMLENLHYLGFAAFFFLTGRGPYAIDRLLFPALEPSPALARRAMIFLRAATGLGLAVVAFTEKLADPALAQAFLQRYALNFTPWLGIPISDQVFVLCDRHDGAVHRPLSGIRLLPAADRRHRLGVHQHDAHDLQLGRARRTLAVVRRDGRVAGVDAHRGGATPLGARSPRRTAGAHREHVRLVGTTRADAAGRLRSGTRDGGIERVAHRRRAVANLPLFVRSDEVWSQRVGRDRRLASQSLLGAARDTSRYDRCTSWRRGCQRTRHSLRLRRVARWL